MMVIIITVKSKDLDNSNGAMELSILESLYKIICMVVENIYGQMKDNMRENG